MSSSRLDLSERYRLHALYETGMSMARHRRCIGACAQHDQS
nr:hypothetical protein [Xanthomonas oryzae]